MNQEQQSEGTEVKRLPRLKLRLKKQRSRLTSRSKKRRASLQRRYKPIRRDWRSKKKLTRKASIDPNTTAIDLEGERSLSFENGYRRGKYDGGEAILGSLIPEHMVLPDVPVEHVIALGLEQVRNQLRPLTDPEGLFIELQAALHERRPFSLVRLGDGELLAMAHDKVLSSGLVRREGLFLGYSGFDIPNHHYREQLAEAVRQATYVGIPISRLPNYYGLLLPTFRAYGFHLGHLRLTSSTVNYTLAQQGYLQRLLQGKRVMIVGNAAHELSHVLQQRGVHVVGAVSPVLGMHDVPRVVQEASEYDYDLALVAAGIPAVIIAQRMAAQSGTVALDIGHLANEICNGEAPF